MVCLKTMILYYLEFLLFPKASWWFLTVSAIDCWQTFSLQYAIVCRSRELFALHIKYFDSFIAFKTAGGLSTW